MADRLGMDRISAWFDRFGLGRPTGLGIAETSGLLPIDAPKTLKAMLSTTWRSGIGEGWIRATPIQMANVSATIARGGIWMRPKLLCEDVPFNTSPTTQPASRRPPRDGVIDLHIDPSALEAAKRGMERVVNSAGGTGQEAARHDIEVAGKTGTAQTSPFKIPLRDPAGKFTGWGDVQPSTWDQINPQAPWYRVLIDANGIHLNHGWFICYVPANRPKLAIAVFVEYGCAGGTAAKLSTGVIDACIKHGYLAGSSISKDDRINRSLAQR